MQLAKYLERINYSAPPKVDIETLFALHRHHLLTIPYEYFDVHLGAPMDISIANAYAKIVERGRGGWCYEMNGLLGWALAEIGFDVRRMAGGVMQSKLGDASRNNHLVLGVQLEQKWIVDVGLGDGLIEPIPLLAGDYRQFGFTFRLEQLADSWRFHSHANGAAPNFDFSWQRADEKMLAEKCAWLSSDPSSNFVKNVSCQMLTASGYDIQLGRVAKTITTDGISSRIIDSADELVASVAERFGLDLPEIANLWDGICQRHEEVMRARDA